MIRNIIRYVGLALVIVGIILVMKNLFSSDTNNSTFRNKNIYYNVSIKLLDEKSGEYVDGATLVLKDSKNKIIEEWVTENSEHTIVKLEKGTYVLEQSKAGEGYLINDKTITFKISDKNKDVVMYNSLSVEEEVKNTSSEIEVDNTLSMKNRLSIMVAIVSIICGMMLVVKNNVIKER